MKAPTGYVIYDGPSTITGAPIVATLTLRSANTKTGDIPQLWILDGETAPHKAARSGADASVCGGCPYRGGACYVLTHRAPLHIWKRWCDGKYPPADAAKLADVLRRRAPRAIRLGAYGDPVAIPLPVLRVFVEVARAADVVVLGYTHRWRAPMAHGYRGFLMASVDSPAEQAAAVNAGWRTFRVRLAGEALLTDERACPAETDALTCNACRKCDGMASGHKASVAIHAHGSPSKLSAYRKYRHARGPM